MTQQDIKTLMQGFAQVVNESSQNIYSQMQNLQVLVQDVGQASLAQQKQTTQVVAALNNMQQSMQTLAANLQVYNKNMQAVGQQLGKTQQQLALLLAEQSASVQKLTLRAVVPGRAWLVDDQGNTTTVTVGTQLPNYGTVVNIDSGKAQVVMSTGYVFK
jgi:ABC-type transporter Mla subunit MlaD